MPPANNSIYSTGVQIVSCTLPSDSVLLVSANEISFDKKLANRIVSFNWCLAWKNIILPLHLVTSTGFLKAYLEYYSNYDI